jgi:cyclopropane fatty-acyl-phospholipid synthase-like methyltransferase
MTESQSALRDYYETNTRLFLHLSGGRSTYSLHRPVWGEGVSSRAEAFAYPYRLVAREVEALPDPGEPVRVLDLGCGVGGGVFHLVEESRGPVSATGVTLSPTQVRLARREARRRGCSGACSFRLGNFLDLPALPAVDLAYAIEAFVLASDPAQFFREAAAAIRPGGRLVLIDDLLAPTAQRSGADGRAQRWIRTFRAGWQAAGLRSADTVRSLAREEGFVCRDDRDLTPALHLDRPRDRLIAWAVVPLRPLLWRWAYFRGLIGGHALQQCLKRGLIRYRCLVFERTDSQ